MRVGGTEELKSECKQLIGEQIQVDAKRVKPCLLHGENDLIENLLDQSIRSADYLGIRREDELLIPLTAELRSIDA